MRELSSTGGGLERRIDQEYVDQRFGFPVVIKNAPMRKALDEWVLDINANELRKAVMGALVFKPAPLSGSEIRAIRLFLERTISSFAEACGVTHPAVIKWESAGDEPTKMAAGTEFLVRFRLLDRLAAELHPEVSAEEDREERGNFSLLPRHVLPLSRRLSSMWGKRTTARRSKTDRAALTAIVINSAGQLRLSST